MPEVIAAIDRTVLLGNPGGGKSTFALKLVHLLASAPQEPHIGGRRLLPLFVTLRDYADAKTRAHCHEFEIPPHQLFLAFAFGALCVECVKAKSRGLRVTISMKRVEYRFKTLAAAPHPAIQAVGRILRTRMDSRREDPTSLSLRSLEVLKMPANQIEFIASWQERKIDLIATPKAKS